MKTTTTLKLIIILLTLLGVGIESARAQCPTVTLAHQSFCDVQSPTISDLVATDNGNGIVWYSSADSTVPLNSVLPLNHGATYYADDNSGACGNRQSVYVSIYTAPTGPSFQTPCAESETEATIGTHLALIGNNVQWYNVPEGGTPLPLGTQITGNSIYYASQINPFTGCETSRKAVYVNEVVIIEPPQGDPVQYFCNDPNNAPTLADVVIIAPGVKWYSSMTSVVQLPLTTPLVDGTTYYVASVSEPCTSTTRLGVTVEFVDINNAGASSDINLCDVNLPPSGTLNLFDSLNGTPSTSGTWTGDLPTTDGHLGTLDLTMLDFGVVYTFTYTVSDSAVCPIATATVTVVIENTLNPGLSNSIILCPGDTAAVDLFGYLGGTPDAGGIWVPALASGTGIFNPALDAFGVYTYTFNDGCSDTATVTVVMEDTPDPGLSNSIILCPGDTAAVDLFGYLGGTPDTGGVWVPALASGTGVFNPSLDAFGVYTYTFNNGCSLESTITVVKGIIRNPGDDGFTPPICPNSTGDINLIDYLGGTPDAGGIWVPALASGTGIFNPALDAFGVYTYTFNDGCSDTATVTVVMEDTPDPGLSNSIILCPGDTAAVDLFGYLGGTPDTGGVWVPALASGTGVFNPSLDAFGVYTYTFNNGCSLESTITVVKGIIRNPGDDGFTPPICPNSTGDINLIDYLGGTPDAGGIWVPALASGTGIFNPALDAFGVYTYTFNDGCSDTATVTVVMEDTPDPGLSNSIILCPGDTAAVDLFGYLGGTPDTGGVWVPALASGTGVFNPSLDAFGVYTYTFNNGCSLESTITVVEGIIRNPGDDGFTPPICPNSTGDINLIDYLGGTPDAGGIWVPALASGTGIFNPALDAFGVYTYTFNDGCSDTATVTVVMEDTPDPGLSNSIILCPGDTAAVDLFGYLGGTPDTGGVWVPALASGTGVFNPSLDAFGVYTYTFNNGCSLESTITVVEGIIRNPGDDGFTPPICPNSTGDINLIDYLGGTPDAGGIWVPALASGTGIFNPALDAFGVYTYTFNDGCSDAATVTVVMEDTPDPGLSNSIILCPGDTAAVDLFGYLGGTPDTGGVWVPALASGTGVFNPSLDAFGVYTYTFNNGCSLESTITVVEGIIRNPGDDGFTPPICPNSTDDINLIDYLGGTPDTGGFWVPALASGTGIFNPALDAFGVYTYTFNDGCSDTATVTVVEDICVEDLVIPDGFSPNGDGINDYFEILNIRTLYPDYKIEIYNRYGNVLFKGDASKPDWDGTSSSALFGDDTVPVGVYFFIIKFNDGQREPLQGRLYLSR